MLRHCLSLILPFFRQYTHRGYPERNALGVQSIQCHLLQFVAVSINDYSLLPKTSNLTLPELMRNPSDPNSSSVYCRNKKKMS